MCMQAIQSLHLVQRAEPDPNRQAEIRNERAEYETAPIFVELDTIQDSLEPNAEVLCDEV